MRRAALVVITTALLASCSSRAEGEPALGPAEAAFSADSRLAVIQKRKFQLKNEFLFAGGVLPVDPYYKGVIGTFGYTLHFSDAWAWEIGQFTYAYNLGTSLLRYVQRTTLLNSGRSPEVPAVQWIATTHLVLKPLYGKEAAFNTQVVHLEAFLQAGPAVVGMANSTTKLDYGFDVGGGLRLWLSRHWSTRLDLGELVYLHNEAGSTHVRQTLELRLGFAATLGAEE
jgi:outer membrane beta-barrel protein